MTVAKYSAAALLSVLGAMTLCASIASADQTILNVSYDPTRELYAAYNRAFEQHWEQVTHQEVSVNQSNCASGKQAQAVVDGNDADVVTLALGYDIDHISQAGLIKPGWQSRFPDNSTPYTSTIVFLVRKGNPKHIRDWSDLVRPGVQIITSNPKSSGGARWSFLAAYGYALRANHGNQAAAQAFVKRLYANVPILPTGARGATEAFVQQQQGDVLLGWENDALLTVHKLAVGQFEIVRPSVSILAEPPVAVVDSNVDAHHTRAVATAYLNWLYSPQGQQIAADNYYRPRLQSALANHAADFPKLTLFDIKTFGGWDNAQRTFFSNGGVFDQIYSK
jgi:sulfate/thiosulfate transport system substrate-binding protein